MNEILKRIDERIEKLREFDNGIGSNDIPLIIKGMGIARGIVEDDFCTSCSEDFSLLSKDFTNVCEENDRLKEIILSQQKEPCGYCKENPCWLCAFAGECRSVEHCKQNNKADYKPIHNYCHVCGRLLNHLHNG